MIDISKDVVGNHNASFITYLQFVQTVIARMGENSFRLKEWCVTLVAGLAALAFQGARSSLMGVAAGVALIFALLDGYYLMLEKRYRELYAQIVRGNPRIQLFSMSLENTSRFGAGCKRGLFCLYGKALISVSVSGFYGCLIALCVFVGYLIR